MSGCAQDEPLGVGLVLETVDDVLDRLGIPGRRGQILWRLSYLEGYVGRIRAFDEHMLDAAEEDRCDALMGKNKGKDLVRVYPSNNE